MGRGQRTAGRSHLHNVGSGDRTPVVRPGSSPAEPFCKQANLVLHLAPAPRGQEAITLVLNKYLKTTRVLLASGPQY